MRSYLLKRDNLKFGHFISPDFIGKVLWQDMHVFVPSLDQSLISSKRALPAKHNSFERFWKQIINERKALCTELCAFIP